MPALGAMAELGSRWCRIERVAANAVERRLAPLEFEAPVIASIVPKPQAEKYHADDNAVNDDSGDEIEHCGIPIGPRW